MTDPLAELARLLESARVPYALIGAHAVNAWLEPRFTADVDVMVQASADGIADLRRTLAEAGFAVVREHGAQLPSGPDFVRFESPHSALVLEIQAAKTEFQREGIRRARTSRRGRVATPEDLIVMKLIANRPKDRIDLEGLVRLPDLDWHYVEQWAAQWEVSDLLRDLRARLR